MKGLKPFLSLTLGILLCAIMMGCAGSVPQNGPGALNIAEFTLEDGVIGVAYKQLLVASGGVTPYTWTISSGHLPPGLSLNSDGVISGTPTTLGAFQFTAKVVDSDTPVQAYNTFTTTITVNPVLSLTSSPLSSGLVGGSYSVNITASNGLPPYTYALAGNTTLPAGLTLTTNTSTDGGANSATISGTPTTAGVFDFTIQATDSYSEVATASYSITVVGQLQGPYVLIFNGFDHDQPFYDVANIVAGLENKNGTGSITGVLDQMGPGSSTTSALPLTGSYTIGASSNFATMTLTRSDNNTSLNFNIVISTTTDTKVILSDPNAPYAYGSGLLKKQSATTVTGTPNYSFGLYGTDASGDRYAAAGMFEVGAYANGSQPITAGEEDTNDNGTVPTSPTAITGGTLTLLDTNTGRGTLSLVSSSGTNNYVFYVVSGGATGEIVALDTDTAGPTTLADMQQQQSAGISGSFTNASLKGQSVIELDGLTTSGPTAPSAAVGVVSFDGAGNITGPTATDGTQLPGYYTDENDGGTTSPVQYQTGTYNVDPTCGTLIQSACGRVTVTLANDQNPPVWYLVNGNQAFSLGTTAAVLYGTLQPQTVPTIGFSLVNLLGSYLGGTISPVLSSVTNELDVAATPPPGGIWAYQYDVSGPNGPLNQQTFNANYGCGGTAPACDDMGTYFGRFQFTNPADSGTLQYVYVLGSGSSGITGSKGGLVGMNVGDVNSSGGTTPDPNPRITNYTR